MKQRLREQEELNGIEKKILKTRVEELIHQSKVHRSHEDDYHLKDSKEKREAL